MPTIFDRYDPVRDADLRISPRLLWEYDLSHFDWQAGRRIVVQRVIERGDLKDYFAAFNLYGGQEGFREIIKEVPALSDMDMQFVCHNFHLKPEELQCYRHKLSRESLGLR
jgi:hypothetical protein